MKPWQAAHLRMLESLPKTTHRSDDGVGDINWRRWRRRRVGNRSQAVIVNGVRYDSLTIAANSLGSNRPAILKMVERGEAELE
jgi:hypothetical protein